MGVNLSAEHRRCGLCLHVNLMESTTIPQRFSADSARARVECGRFAIPVRRGQSDSFGVHKNSAKSERNRSDPCTSVAKNVDIRDNMPVVTRKESGPALNPDHKLAAEGIIYDSPRWPSR